MRSFCYLLPLVHLLGKLFSAQDVKMQVLHALASVSSNVRDHAIALRQALLGGDLGNGAEDVSQNGSVLLRDRVHRRDVALGDHENVGGRLGVDVAKRQNRLALKNLRGGNFSPSDLAKKAIHAVFPFRFKYYQIQYIIKLKKVQG